jgi:hypothetical protein
MKKRVGQRLGAGLALAVGLAFGAIGVAQAQAGPAFSGGVVRGEVDNCTSGNETPAANVAVTVADGSASTVRSDTDGTFVLALPPGQYTIVVTAPDGSTGSRPYVPVQAGQSLDIGIIDLNSPGGCLGDTGLTPGAPAAPAVTAPTPTVAPAAPTVAPPAPTPTVAPPPPTPTAVPAAPSDNPSGSAGSGG